MAQLASQETLKKLYIEGFKDPDCTDSTGAKFEAQINPATITIKHKIAHAPKQQSDQSPSADVTSEEAPLDLSFALILDDTGVLGGDASGGGTFIDEQIEKLKKACYYYVGENHEHTYCKISWDKDLLSYKGASFGGKLSSMSIAYTLFSPSGSPLRAKIDLAFVGVWTEKTKVKALDKQSPDLTHVITVRIGDNLPMLCQQIYGDASLYTEIAKYNSIVNFRYLEPGAEITFPPMK